MTSSQNLKWLIAASNAIMLIPSFINSGFCEIAICADCFSPKSRNWMDWYPTAIPDKGLKGLSKYKYSAVDLVSKRSIQAILIKSSLTAFFNPRKTGLAR